MKKRNGFTLLEMMVTMAVFAIVAASAIALFQFHGKSSAASTKRKLARETVTLALMTIQRDIERAGLGLMQQQPLSIFVKRGPPDQLYVSFSDHVSMDLSKGKTWSFFDILSTPGLNKLWWQLSGNQVVLTDVGTWIGTDSTAPPIGALIRQQGTNKPDAADVTFAVAPQSSTQKTKGQCTVTLTLPSPYTANVAPAISYRLIATKTDQDAFAAGQKPELGTLLRNGVPIVGAKQYTDGTGTVKWEKVPFIKVTDFQVRCGFRTTGCDFTRYYSDRTQTACWSPDNGKALGDSGWEADKLRVVEIRIKYILLDKGGGASYPADMKVGGFSIADDNKNTTPKAYGPWALGGDQTITVSPRNIVLGQYLGPPK